MTLDPGWPRRRDFLHLWAAQSVSQVGTLLGVLPLVAIVALEASPLEVGLVQMFLVAPAMVLGIAAGTLADRTRRRPLMLTADLGRALVLLLVPLAAWLDWLSIWLLFGVAAAMGTLTILFDVAWQAYVPVLVERERLIDANSKLGTSESVAEIGAPALGGVLVQVLTAPFAVLFDALSFLVSALFLLRIRAPEPPPRGEEDRAGFLRESLEGFGVVWRSPALRAVVGSEASFNLAGGFFWALYGLFVIRTLDFSPAVLGVLVGAGGVGALAGAVAAGRVPARISYPRLLAATLLTSVSLNLVVPFAGGPDVVAFGVLFATQILGDFFLSIFFVALLTFRQMQAPDHLLGRVNATARVSVASASLVGLLAGGVAGEVLGVREALLVGALAMFAGPAWYLPLLRHGRERV